ncbi:extensin-like [Arachis duranensis]|uniref:Extensin-like n=2 Tax=Arachis duranensis TaxID=130453 RepID=A0A6P4D983_ARADU|nr:extensin-like [Arachis duranensis]XP_015964307.1 extensin-like [Arachis duranensis]
MGAYNNTYQFVIQPVPSQEYWQHVDLPPILPPVYKKQIGRPKLKRDKKNDAPKEPTPDSHRAPRKCGPITCKYCLKTGHNSRSCSKKKEAMAGSETIPVPQPVPNPVRSPSTRPPTAKRPPKKKKNLRRPPPTTRQPQSAPATPTTTSPSPPASDVPPIVTPQTMQAASQDTTSRFMEFMTTPTVRGSSSSRWPQPAFRPPPKKGSTTAHLKEGSSGSSNSTPNP